MKCPYCGGSHSDAALFCEKTGKRIPKNHQASSSDQEFENFINELERKRKIDNIKSSIDKGWDIAKAVGGFIISALAVACFWGLL